MSKKPGQHERKTAAELMSQLESDQEFVAAQEQRERLRQERETEWRRAEGPLLEELQSAGIKVSSVWDLVNTTTPYPGALPILLKHLQHPYPDRVREGVARAMAVREARFAWGALRDLYQREPPGTDAKDGLAAALSAVADNEVIDELIALLKDPKHGESRLLLLAGLERLRHPKALSALVELERDAQLES